MNLQQIVSFVQHSPTGLALLDCAIRTGTRFGIRGGVARNLLMDTSEQLRDLFDAVDPFSDIDLIVESNEEGTRILEAIFASVSFAGFYRWEVMVRDRAVSWLETHVHLASDESVIWINGKGVATVAVSKLVEASGIVLSAQFRDIDLTKQFAEVPLDNLLVTYIKVLAILARRENETDNNEIIQKFRDLLQLRAETLATISEHTMLRVNLQIAKLFGASIQLGRETAALNPLKDLLNGIGITSELLTIVSGLNRFSEAALAIWRSGSLLQFKVVETNGQSGNVQGNNFIVPRFTIPSPWSGGCCPYSDFPQGPAVLMWRRPTPYPLRLERSVLLASEESAADGVLESAESSYDVFRSEEFQIPNLLSIRRGLVARMDHAFLGALLGRSVLMQLTVREVEEGA